MAKKSRLKSKTNWTALAVSVLGVIEMNYPMLKPMLGDYYGLSFIAVGIVMAVLREFTKEPVRDK